MKKLIFGLFLAVSLPSYGQGVNRCIDSIYAAYLANYTSPTPAQKASSLQLATKQCKAMAGLISDTGLVWADTLTYLATKSNIATSTSGWQLAGNTLSGIKYLGSTNNVNWSMIVNGTVQATLTGSGITLNDGAAISTGTTVGSTFGNATNQRISFYGYTPIVQPTGDVLAALSSLGLVSSPTLPSSGVTSVNGNNGTMVISPTTGAVLLGVDTTVVSTKKWRQKGVDSITNYFIPFADTSSQYGTSRNVVSRDPNGNTHSNNFESATTSVTATAGTSTLTIASARIQILTGNTTQTFQLPDATTMHNGHAFEFNNNTTNSNLYVVDNSSGAIATVPYGGYGVAILTYNYTSAGTWDFHYYIPKNASFGTKGLSVTGYIKASGNDSATKFVTSGGTSSQFVKGDGSLDGTSYGTGTVISVATSYGITGGTITASGTLTADTSKLSTIATARRLADSAAASVSTGGTVTSIATALPITGGTITSTGTIGIQVANTSQSGYLTSTDWNTFNGKQGAITLTTTGTSGAATLTGTTLNIPNYTVSGTMVNSITASRGITASGSTGAVTLAMDTTGAYTWTGAQTLQQNSIGTTATAAVTLTNTVAATSGNPQYSPGLYFHGANWYTTGSASYPQDWRIYVNTASNSNPVSSFSFGQNNNGGGWTEIMNLQRNAINLEQPVTISSTYSLTSPFITISSKLSVTTGTNKSAGTATLSSGTVTVSTTQVTSSSLIWVQYQAGGTLSGATLTRNIRVSTITAGTSFVVVAETAPGTTNTSDNSPIQWWIIN